MKTLTAAVFIWVISRSIFDKETQDMSIFASLTGMVAGCFLSAFFFGGSYLTAAEHSFWLVFGGLYIAFITRKERA